MFLCTLKKLGFIISSNLLEFEIRNIKHTKIYSNRRLRKHAKQDELTKNNTMRKITNFYFLMTFKAVLCPVNACFIPKGHSTYHLVLLFC